MHGPLMVILVASKKPRMPRANDWGTKRSFTDKITRQRGQVVNELNSRHPDYE